MNKELDKQLGRDAIPFRYNAGERETIDRIRDSMSDESFMEFCEGQIIRYRDRAGKKGTEETKAEDLKKADFYLDMLLHVKGFRADPRVYRKEPYKRQPFHMSSVFTQEEQEKILF